MAYTDIKWQKMGAGENLVRHGYGFGLHGLSEEDNPKRIRLAVHECSEPKAKYYLMMNLKIRCFKLFRRRTSFRPAWRA
jgi:hypothetical protein